MRVDVRTVLYTDDMEPITVVELSQFAKNHLERYGEVRLHITEPVAFYSEERRPSFYDVKIVRIWAERIVRKGDEHFLLFTRDDENALLLKAAFLPGQYKEVNNERSQAFANGFLKALRELGSLD